MKLGGRRVCVAAGRACERRFARAYRRVNLACADGLLYTRAKVLATVPVGAGPNAIRYLDGSVWVRNLADGTVSRIDPAGNSVVATIKTGAGWGDLTYGDGSIWDVSEETGLVSRIDPATNSVVATISTEGIRPMGVAWMPGSIWAGNHAHRAGEKATVVRIDTATNRVVWRTGVGQATFDESGGPQTLTAAFGSVWMQVPNGGTLERIDPSTGSITAIPTARCDGHPEALAGSLWLAVGCSNVISRIDPATNQIVGRIVGPSGSIFPLAADGAFLWATTSNKILLQIDPTTSKIVGRWWQPAGGLFGGPAVITYGASSIWVSDTPHNRVLRLAP
jgi:YVTN family beta-propeller protein